MGLRFLPPSSGVSSLLSLSLLLLSGCLASGKPPSLPATEFVSTNKHSRMFSATEAQTCEAARRALLSQGYVVTSTSTNTSMVTARKSFQPGQESHMELEFRVVCAAANATPRPALAFVSAQKDTYALKKSNNSASLGVGVLGSVSLPLASSSDSLVKVGSETIGSESFYDRFFELLVQYLPEDEPSP